MKMRKGDEFCGGARHHEVWMMNESVYLAQSYLDAWSDYQRSLKVPAFPVWDYVILTASNEHQAQSFRLQIDARRKGLPPRTRFEVIPDEGGVRVGSGGATLSVLKYLRKYESSFKGLRILVIHSGGDSKRVPQYSALGKLFSPVFYHIHKMSHRLGNSLIHLRGISYGIKKIVCQLFFIEIRAFLLILRSVLRYRGVLQIDRQLAYTGKSQIIRPIHLYKALCKLLFLLLSSLFYCIVTYALRCGRRPRFRSAAGP